MTRRPLIIGQAPPRSAGPDYVPLSIGCGPRLAAMMGEAGSEFFQLFDTANVLDHYPGPAPGGHGDQFPMSEARPAAACMLQSGLMCGRIVTLLGHGVAHAFDFEVDVLRVYPAVIVHGSEILPDGRAVRPCIQRSDVNAIELYAHGIMFERAGPPCVAGACPVALCVVPHPSGLNRWWNSRENRANASDFLRGLAAAAVTARDSGAFRSSVGVSR